MIGQSRDKLRGALCGLSAAALFGVSAPLAKTLLGVVPPLLLAGLLYLGAAAGLWLTRLLRPGTREARLVRGDWLKLSGVTLAGGVLGPVLMLYGLSRVSALAGSLLLNLELAFTVLLAVFAFGEQLGRAGAAAVLLILCGAAALKLAPGELAADGLGSALLASACLCWAFDNNLTQQLSLRDPFAVVRVKTLVAGSVNSLLAQLLLGQQLPPLAYVAGALLLGSVSYGLSVVLDAYALRFIGAAREAAYFATAPAAGALTALLLGDALEPFGLVAMLLMALGIVLLLRERHGHLHSHEPLEHTHLHSHDEHHRHAHGSDDPPGEPHSHHHHHSPLVHDHPHVPDAHHRHPH